MRLPTMWYARPAKPQISLRIRAVWSEPLSVAWVFFIVKLLTEHNLEFLSLRGGCRGWSESTLVKYLEISCRGSNVIGSNETYRYLWDFCTPTPLWIRPCFYNWSKSFRSWIKWASSRENLSSGFPTKRDSNQFPQLQRLARKLKFSHMARLHWYFSKSE